VASLIPRGQGASETVHAAAISSPAPSSVSDGGCPGACGRLSHWEVGAGVLTGKGCSMTPRRSVGLVR
jgi:hypothetical protein